jgi:hypothetical protein
MVMAAKLTRLTHKIAIQLHLVTAVPFAVLAPGGLSGYSQLNSEYMCVYVCMYVCMYVCIYDFRKYYRFCFPCRIYEHGLAHG